MTLAFLLTALPLMAAAADTDAPAVAAAEAAPSAPGSASMDPARSASPASYLVGPNDEVEIVVIGHDEFDATVEVTPERTIVLPILGQIDVAGLNAREIGERVTSRLADGYLRDPRVVVEIQQFNNMVVWVFGHVAKPGEYHLDGPTTMLGLLNRVGDVTTTAGDAITVERTTRSTTTDDAGRSVDRKDTLTIAIDLEKLLIDGNLAENLTLQNGDKVYVPGVTSKVYAFGEVKEPGFYAYDEGMTLADLIEAAGGFTEWANDKKIRIKRADLPQEIKVNLKKYYEGGELSANITLDEGDVVLVKSSFFF